MVRETLGEDAIIIATREERGGKAVRVTAAIEQYDESARAPAFEISRDSVPADPEDWLQYDDEDIEATINEELTDAMLRHGVPEDVTDMILSCATVMGLEQPHIALIAALEHLYGFRPLPRKACRKPLMVVGPPGSGKTLAVAKMAARGVMDGLKVVAITTDTVRAGGLEQLSAFTKILKVPLLKAATPEELKAALEKTNAADQVLIDTGGLNPFSKEEVKSLAKLIAAGDVDPILVMPAAGDAEESGEIARVFATVGVRWMLPTRLDISRRLGGLLQAAHQGGLAFADASNTPQVAEGLMAMTPENLCELLMPGAGKGTRQKSKTRTGH